jgi:hypothetical protein
MVRIWSELPGARLREQAADLATLAWLSLWGAVGWQLYQSVAGFSEAGRVVQTGGRTMIDGGRDLGNALAGIPLVGEGLRDVARNAFSGAGVPLSDFGIALEGFVILVAGVLTLLLILVMVVPWLTHYVPWRSRRVRLVRAGHRAIRVAPSLDPSRLDEVLAMRAVSRLDFATLLAFTPDPLGDWAAGRYERLAEAELASVGLRA